MSASCCGHNEPFDGLDPRYKRILWIVIAINGAMFAVETWGGYAANSRALEADALDFLGDSLTYGISLWAIGKSINLRGKIAMLKGVSLLLMGVYVFSKTVYEVFVLEVPQAELMGTIGFMALAANVASVMLLARYKDGDANVRSVWLCSRNDAIGNVIVIAAAGVVWGTMSGWPDVIVAGIMAGLFINSAWLILVQARAELAQGDGVGGEASVCEAVEEAHTHEACGGGGGGEGHARNSESQNTISKS